MNRLAVPLRTYSQSKRATWPGRNGSGVRTSPINCVLNSSRHTTGRRGSAGRRYTPSTSSIRQTNSADGLGGTHHIRRRCGLRAFAPQPLAHRLAAQVGHDVQGHHLPGRAQTASPFRSSRSVQRFSPAGGSEQASAVSRASCDPSSLRAYMRELGLGSRAASSPSSTKRWRTRPMTRTLTLSASEIAASDQPGPLRTHPLAAKPAHGSACGHPPCHARSPDQARLALLSSASPDAASSSLPPAANLSRRRSVPRLPKQR